MLTSPRPAKRPRPDSESQTISSWPARNMAVAVPLLLRKLDHKIVVVKCLEAISNERILRASDLIDKIILDQFLGLSEIQNRNKTNIKDAKNYICKQIGPILYQLINQYLEVELDDDSPTTVEDPQSPLQQRKQEKEEKLTPVDVPVVVDLKPDRKPPPLFYSSLDLSNSPGDTIGVHIDESNGAVKKWLTSKDGPDPFRKHPVEPLPTANRLSETSVGSIDELGEIPWDYRAPSEAEIPSRDSISVTGTSRARTQSMAGRINSVSGNTATDKHETRSIVSATAKSARGMRQGLIRSCTFCNKELPSPSARREHESIHVFQLRQYKQYQCKHTGCTYQSHRPREIFHHMKNKHNWEGKSRGVSMEELIDRGPLSEEEMVALRRQYQAERSEGVNLTGANFGLTAPNIKIPDRDLQADRDELASQHNTIISMDYSYTQNTPIQAHLPAQLTSSMFGIGSNFDDSNSLIMRDNLDQTSQVDFAMDGFTNFRNSIGAYTGQSFLPQGTQLMGVGAAHAGSTLTNIPSTIDVDEDAQGENDVEWSENLVVTTMKGG